MIQLANRQEETGIETTVVDLREREWSIPQSAELFAQHRTIQSAVGRWRQLRLAPGFYRFTGGSEQDLELRAIGTEHPHIQSRLSCLASGFHCRVARSCPLEQSCLRRPDDAPARRHPLAGLD